MDAELFADWGLNESWVVHRKMITIELTDETGCAVMTWEVTNAWMKKATLSQSPAEPGEVSLEIEFEGNKVLAVKGESTKENGQIEAYQAIFSWMFQTQNSGIQSTRISIPVKQFR